MTNTPTLPLEGVTVVEIASTTFVVATGALLADWGADVITVGGVVGGDAALDEDQALWRQLNRGKRSVTLDAGTGHGEDVLGRLIDRADVFLTDLSPGAAGELTLDLAAVRARNPRVIYSRGTALGPRGPERDRAGSDYTSYWARGGLAATFQPMVGSSQGRPAKEPAQSFGELPTAGVLAGGIAAAVFRRTIDGEGALVDASLLGYAAFNLSMDVAAVSAGIGTLTGTPMLPPDRLSVANPLTNAFRTKDGRFLTLCVMQERLFPQVCADLGRDDLAADERLVDPNQRRQHGPEIVQELDKTFATRTLAEWMKDLADTEWVWEPVQTVDELMADPQVAANEYLRPLDEALPMVVSGPVQFDERSAPLKGAPTPGEHTDAVLAEVGLGSAAEQSRS